jgi:Phage tail lysozyme
MKITEIISELAIPSLDIDPAKASSAMDTMNKMQAFLKNMGIGGNDSTNTSSSGSDATNNTSGSDSSSTGKIVVLGDSLAVGTGSQISGAVVDAKVGISSSAILDKALSNKELKGADLAIISAGANDGYGIDKKNPNSAKTQSNLSAIRKALGAKKYVWILPFNRFAAQDIKAEVGSDATVDLADVATPSKDHLHPTNYGSVAQACINAGGVKPGGKTSSDKTNSDKPSSGKSGPTSISRNGIAGAQKSIKNFVDPKEMANYLSSKGLDKNSIAGLMANAQAESSLNSGVWIPNDVNGPGGGLFGFHDKADGTLKNLTNMIKACGGDNNWQTNWKGQLDHALEQSRYPKTGFKSPGEAAKWFVQNYERPRDQVSAINKRTQFANAFYSKYA